MFWRCLLNAARLAQGAMVRSLTPAIPPKMYRHFAIVTVALTAAIALFANGENREAVAAQIEERQQQEELEQKSRERFGKPTIRRSSRKPRPARFSDSGAEFDESFGRPMDQMVSHNRRSLGTSEQERTPAAQAGYSDQYLATLSEEERKLLLAGLEKEGLLSPTERERKIAALVAASERRSGSPPGEN